MRAPLRLVVIAILAAAALLRHPADAQVRPVYDRGAAGLVQALQRLQTTASVLHVGAHPDDEDSALLARVARGDNARAAYLSLTRGEGGQNIIGTELFEALGVIRTEELLQARRLDGGEQFFTRAIDYGFSKTREEAAAKWGEREILGDVVRVIRMFRPLVVTSRFSGTPADGHGQHQFAGYVTPLAVRVAGDVQQFPGHFADGLHPWAPRLLYVHGDGAQALEVETGVFDPVLGRTYAEIASEGRSQHKSQEMGAIERRGPARSLLRPSDSSAPGASGSLFGGIDTSVTGLAALAGLPAGAIRPELEVLSSAARRALDAYEPLSPDVILPALADAFRAARAARAAVRGGEGSPAARAHADFLLSLEEDEIVDAIARAAGLVIDALADSETVVPGSSIGVSVRAFHPPDAAVRILAAQVNAPAGWAVAPSIEEVRAVAAAERPAEERRFEVTVPATAPLTEPYFLRQPRDGDRYQWPGAAPKALPFAPAVMDASVTFEVAGVTATVRRPVEYRFADRIRGELRRDVHVVPAITVGLDSRLLIVPANSGSAYTARVTASVTSFSDRPIAGTFRLRLPAGWTSTPAEASFDLQTQGARASTAFVITSPETVQAGRIEIAADAMAAGQAFASELQTIAYPHIQTHRLYRPAAVAAQVVDIKVAPVRVGYVMGSGDQVPEAIRRLGVDVTVLDDETLKSGDLSPFDTIVVGVRASEARPDFAAEHARLLQYADGGGTLIVQYQQTDYVTRGLPPYPANPPKGRGNSRVTVETAPVRILAPAHPVFTFPNQITEADFAAWVQERNLYAFDTFDLRYTPLLESADPGEPAQRGGEVYAPVGKGHYVYTAYSWFRQLPAGVPGAYRQFANLISLGRAPRIADSRGADIAPRTAAADPPAGDRTRPFR